MISLEVVSESISHAFTQIYFLRRNLNRPNFDFAVILNVSTLSKFAYFSFGFVSVCFPSNDRFHTLSFLCVIGGMGGHSRNFLQTYLGNFTISVCIILHYDVSGYFCLIYGTLFLRM